MQILWFLFAFIAVLALIGLAAWLVRRFAGNRLGANTNRGRMPRLAVIDAAAVDGRRRLVLVRRDNVEHLLMIGGPTDIVVEPNIVRAMSRDQAPPRPVVTSAEPPPRVAPLPDTAWAEAEGARTEIFETPEPAMPEPPPRPARPSFAEELRRPAAPPLPERRDPLAGFTPEPIGSRPERTEPRPEPIAPRVPRERSEPLIPRPPRTTEPKVAPLRTPERAAAPPAPPPPPPPPPEDTSSADANLAEMAQRLEAALRRPTSEAAAPPVAPEPPPAPRPARNETPPSAPQPQKSGFENLEDEMASLLGRPKNPS
ncbi:flagellar biosynthetic protein FliO [Bradyrhizobium sp. BRP22]|uniref:flagellar biosynthetic protein FliO n=1 Tax=Bradyrhizobium sp. BRP22 TaxID=2793821 RepID=UPI001CD58BAA|nr:flagellar biosynthetic protein FliO [Bradyrhizobium sp. BRP22]MCA1455874.1 flagellar biosynthetic protein FliO [Bradyrhizobium sp. BRP22]